MGYTFRTSGPWGIGNNQDLTPEQVDNNFWQAIQDNQAKAVQGVGIANIVVHGNQFTVVLTDHTLLGPYDIPMMTIQFKGEWAPNTQYYAGDIITSVGATYMVEINHVSNATFDAGANDGMGNDYYGVLLKSAAATLPSGGPAGWFLRKSTSADYAVHWTTAAITEMTDVAIASPTNGDILSYESGHWQNLPAPPLALDNLTDVAITGPADGDVLTYNASATDWINKAISVALSGLTDVNLSTPVAGQPLIFDGTNWVDAVTVDMPCGGINVVSGSLTLDRSAGEVQRLALSSTVTITNIIGWPPGGQFARLVLEVQNSGSFGLAFPNGVLWPSGIAPTMTPNGKDIYILVSFDGGTTIYANIAGQDFR
jgi:hypothetical protein